MPRPRAIIDTEMLTVAFATHGFDGVSASKLAAQLGLAKPTLYAHGHTKHTLYQLALEAEVERLLERLHRAHALASRRSAHDRAAAIALAILNHGNARPHGLQLIARAHAERDATPETEQILVRLQTWITTSLTRGMSHDGLDATLAPSIALALWGATLMLATTSSPSRTPGRERLAALTAALMPVPQDRPSEPWPTAT